jgi:hypothetical protein
MANLKRRVEELERQLAQRPGYSIQFDEDALAIYNSMSYLDATLAPTYQQMSSTSADQRPRRICCARKKNRPSKSRQGSCLEIKGFAKS